MLRRSPLKIKPKGKSAAERRYHDWVATLPCLLCGAWPVCLHHVVSDGFQRITRRHDRVIPLCRICHQDGAQAVHKIGHAAFNELLGYNQLDKAKELWDGR